MQIRLQYIEWLSMDIVLDSGITNPKEMDIVYGCTISTCEQYKPVIKYWTLIWITDIVM